MSTEETIVTETETTTPREINTPQVRHAISAAIHDKVSGEAASRAAGAVFHVLDLASAGQLPPLCACCEDADAWLPIGSGEALCGACGIAEDIDRAAHLGDPS